MSEGFFDRWSRRKAGARAGRPLEEPAPPAAQAPRAPPAQALAEPPVAVPAAASESEPPPPTLEDLQALAPDADFKPFLARGVAPEVRNAALRKLFADPRFNLMDGLDVYIDDYSRADPLPPSLLRQMASARFLQLVEDQTPADVEPRRDHGYGPGSASVAQSAQDMQAAAEPADPQRASSVQEPHADPDLQLQPDHAARREGVGPGD